MRILVGIAALVVAGAAGCNSPTCGPGTKQVQEKGGALRCVPVDQPAELTDCDVDGGNVEIVAGKCVSKIACDPATTMYDPATHRCVGIGTVSGCQPCGTPGPGKFCVTGKIWDFVTNTELMPGQRTVRVKVHDPFAFLGGNTDGLTGGTIASTDKGCYTLNNLDTPAAGLIAVGVDDPAGATSTLALAAVGLPVSSGKSYSLDAFIVERATVNAWQTQSGVSYANGAYVGIYVNSPVETGTRVDNPTSGFTSGVMLLENGMTPASTKYFAASGRGTIDPALTATTATGAAITAVTPGAVKAYSGTGGTCGGGPCKWEARPGGSAAGVIFFNRFKECTTTPSAPSCM
jgi:hypothetical protein